MYTCKNWDANCGNCWMNSLPRPMGLLPDTWNCGMRMRWECRERFPHHQLKRKPLVSNPGMHHGTCVTHVPWCMSGSLTRGGRGKRSRHSRRMRNPQFYVSGKRPIVQFSAAKNCSISKFRMSSIISGLCLSITRNIYHWIHVLCLANL